MTSTNEMFNPMMSFTLKSWGDVPDSHTEILQNNVAIECGWGRLIFGHTFQEARDILDTLKQERPGSRDIAFYLRAPQVLVALSPQELFIDPSYTFRCSLVDYEPKTPARKTFLCREMIPEDDLDAVNCIYQARSMVVLDRDYMLCEGAYENTGYDACKPFTYWVAVDSKTEKILGVAMGMDHREAFNDPENGSSLWALAVDPQATHPGIGKRLVERIMAHYKQLGRSYLDVSVLHNNTQAISLYKKLLFKQVPAFCVKFKNTINEKLFTTEVEDESKLNPYARIITNEARRRGIQVDVVDVDNNLFRLTFGGRSILCRESLSEVTTAVAMSICADKQVTHRLMKKAGIRVPDQQPASSSEANAAFLRRHGALVVKPALGEQGQGITVDVKTTEELESAIKFAGRYPGPVLLEEMVEGQDLRIVLINCEVVAAALRKPPSIMGSGKDRIIELIEKQSRRREVATQGESKIPVDAELLRTLKNAGYELTDVLPEGEELVVRKTANLHTGGTIHDVTDSLHPTLREVAEKIAQTINIPVTGLDLLVADPAKPEYVFIEANERPGLANHEPQPTAEKFIDLLFPYSLR